METQPAIIRIDAALAEIPPSYSKNQTSRQREMWGERPAWQKTTVGFLNLYCSYNDRHWGSVYVVHSTTEVIYVGHTKTGVRNRLAQHMTWASGIHGRSDLGRFLNEYHGRDLMVTIIRCYRACLKSHCEANLRSMSRVIAK